MEAEWEALPDDYDQATSGHMEMATLLKQSILLIGQTFNAITYHSWLNILNTLPVIDVLKEILKERILDLDDIQNP